MRSLTCSGTNLLSFFSVGDALAETTMCVSVSAAIDNLVKVPGSTFISKSLQRLAKCAERRKLLNPVASMLSTRLS